jgi:CTP synthase
LSFSGTSPDGKLVEYVELPREVHPYYVATQAHPELSSRPTRPHPLFAGLVRAALDHQQLDAGEQSAATANAAKADAGKSAPAAAAKPSSAATSK